MNATMHVCASTNRLRDRVGDALHLLEQLDGASRLDHQLARRGID